MPPHNSYTEYREEQSPCTKQGCVLNRYLGVVGLLLVGWLLIQEGNLYIVRSMSFESSLSGRRNGRWAEAWPKHTATDEATTPGVHYQEEGRTGTGNRVKNKWGVFYGDSFNYTLSC